MNSQLLHVESHNIAGVRDAFTCVHLVYILDLWSGLISFRLISLAGMVCGIGKLRGMVQGMMHGILKSHMALWYVT